MPLSTATFTIPSSLLSVGSNPKGSQSIVKGITSLSVVIDMTNHMNPGVTVTLQVDVSYDNGSTWGDTVTASRPGGVAFNEDGTVANNMAIGISLEKPELSTRRIRYSVFVVGGSFLTAGGIVTLQ